MKKYILLKYKNKKKYLLKEVEAEEVDNNCFIYILDDEICINDGLTGMLVCKRYKNNEKYLINTFYALLPRLLHLRSLPKYYNRCYRYKNYLKKL